MRQLEDSDPEQVLQVLSQAVQVCSAESTKVLDGQVVTHSRVEVFSDKDPEQERQFVDRGPEHVAHELSQLRH